MDAAEIIAALGMIRHPEGGWYAETFRDNGGRDKQSAGGRGHSTAIYFLLERGAVSAWHRVKDAAEVWHFYAGSSLEIRIFDETEGMVSSVLGVNLAAGERPQAVVPAGGWQNGTQPGRLHAGRLHGRAGLRFFAIRVGLPRLEPSEPAVG